MYCALGVKYHLYFQTSISWIWSRPECTCPYKLACNLRLVRIYRYSQSYRIVNILLQLVQNVSKSECRFVAILPSWSNLFFASTVSISVLHSAKSSREYQFTPNNSEKYTSHISWRSIYKHAVSPISTSYASAIPRYKCKIIIAKILSVFEIFCH